MKISELKKILEKYDTNKGYGRTLSSFVSIEEPHIKELREFVKTLEGDDRELISTELEKLAKIILGKNTVNQSESSKGFTKLAKFFGGFEPLAALNQQKLLNRKRVVFLEKHPKFAKQFSDTIIFLSSKKIEADMMDLLLKPLDKMKNPEDLPTILKLIEQRATEPGIVHYIHALCSACALGLYTDEVAKYLSVAREIELVCKTLSLIEKFDLTCLDNDRLLAILNLQNLALFYKLLIRFEVSAKHIDILCDIEKQMAQLKSAEVSNEEYLAVEIARVFIALDKAGYYSEQTCEAMLQYPECLEMNARIVNYLTENKLHSEDNFIKAGALRLPEGQFLSILDLLNKAGLLNQENLHALFVKSAYIKTLFSAVRCLANGGVLTQESYNDIVYNPLLALTVVEAYGGKPYSELQPCVVDEGAMDFVEIRKSAKVLAQGQHSLFPSATIKQDTSFKQATGKTIKEAKDYSLIKIAEFCGDGALDKETEANIASLSYFSI